MVVAPPAATLHSRNRPTRRCKLPWWMLPLQGPRGGCRVFRQIDGSAGGAIATMRHQHGQGRAEHFCRHFSLLQGEVGLRCCKRTRSALRRGDNESSLIRQLQENDIIADAALWMHRYEVILFMPLGSSPHHHSFITRRQSRLILALHFLALLSLSCLGAWSAVGILASFCRAWSRVLFLV